MLAGIGAAIAGMVGKRFAGVALYGVIALFAAGGLAWIVHDLKSQGRAQCIAAVKEVTGAESVRQLGVTIETLTARAEDAEASAEARLIRERKSEDVRAIAKGQPGADLVCVPAALADRVRQSVVGE